MPTSTTTGTLPTSIAVYCGSYTGNSATYLAAARSTGERLAQLRVTIVYGGGSTGLMGAVADAALAAGGQVIGVMPQALIDSEIGHRGLAELHVVRSMHERKLKMSELADAFLALPGGAGTLEEITEQWTWAQLGIHAKPCAFLDVNGFYAPLRTVTTQMVTEGFMRNEYDDMLIIDRSLDVLLDRLRNYSPPPRKWSAAEPTVTA